MLLGESGRNSTALRANVFAFGEGLSGAKLCADRLAEPLAYGGRAMQNRGRSIGLWVAVGIAVGVAVGMGAGVGAGSIVSWMAGGAVVGAIIGAAIPKRRS